MMAREGGFRSAAHPLDYGMLISIVTWHWMWLIRWFWLIKFKKNKVLAGLALIVCEPSDQCLPVAAADSSGDLWIGFASQTKGSNTSGWLQAFAHLPKLHGQSGAPVRFGTRSSDLRPKSHYGIRLCSLRSPRKANSLKNWISEDQIWILHWKILSEKIISCANSLLLKRERKATPRSPVTWQRTSSVHLTSSAIQHNHRTFSAIQHSHLTSSTTRHWPSPSTVC